MEGRPQSRGRRTARAVLTVVGFGGAAVFSHYVLGESWSEVAWMVTSLSVVLIAVQEALEARARKRAGQQGD